MKKRWMMILSLMVSALTACGTEQTETTVLSNTTPNNCRICQHLNDTPRADNLGMFTLLPFAVSPIDIIQYDDAGNQIDASFGVSKTWSLFNDDRAESATAFGFINPDRRYLSGTIGLKKIRKIDATNLAQMYCQPCLDKLFGSSFDPDLLYGVGVINYENGTVHVLEQQITGFTMGNYYVEAIQTSEESAHILVFHCPP